MNSMIINNSFERSCCKIKDNSKSSNFSFPNTFIHVLIYSNFFQELCYTAGTCYVPAEMTEVADMTVADHRVATVRHYEAGPPPGLELVSTVLFLLIAFIFTHLHEGRGNKTVRPTLFYAESKQALCSRKIKWINGSSLCELWVFA